MWQQIGEVFLEGFVDTLTLFPFILLIYILIEVLEHKTSLTRNRKILQGGFAPLIGSAAGIIPLCGFSVMAAKLYDRGHVRTGTVLAVFIATSDEALILLLSNVTNLRALSAILPLIAIQFVLAVAVGYAANAILFKEKTEARGEVAAYSCGHEDEGKSNLDIYFLIPLWHALKIALYLFVVNIVFGLIISFVGEDSIANALGVNVYLQPLITSAVGLIPSCASSVIVTTAYVNGIISFGSLVAGLAVNAGMGFMILLRNTKKLKRNLALIASAFAIAYVAGILVNLFAPYLNL